jgi:uncharacterized protein YndB with AHSA1/START domain
MPTASETRVLQAPAGVLWDLVCDPHHLPRWWPRVERVEGVEDALFTEVLRSGSGQRVRADFEITQRDPSQMRMIFEQQIAGTPFARVLAASVTEVHVQPRMGMNDSASTEVTITLAQTPHRWLAGSSANQPAGFPMLNGLFARLGGPMMRRAAIKTVKDALDGLDRISS